MGLVGILHKCKAFVGSHPEQSRVLVTVDVPYNVRLQPSVCVDQGVLGEPQGLVGVVRIADLIESTAPCSNPQHPIALIHDMSRLLRIKRGHGVETLIGWIVTVEPVVPRANPDISLMVLKQRGDGCLWHLGIAPFAALKHKGVVLRLIAVESSLTSDPQRLVAGEEHTFHNVAIGEVLEVIALGAPILQVHAAHPLARANPKAVVAIVKHTGDLIGGKQVWEEQRVAITLHMTAVVTVKAVGCANPHKPVVVLVECGDVVVGDGLRQVDRYKAHLGQRLALNRKDTQQQAGHEHAHPTPQGVASY